MELRQLRYLVALADEQHFTRAAAREHIAQPALSQQIRRLEHEVGLALVERTTRKVTVTEAGRTLVARARRILSEVDAAKRGDAGARRRPGRARVGRHDAHDGAGGRVACAGGVPRAPPGRRADRPRAVERGARRDAPRRRARPGVPVGDRADRDPGARPAPARVRGARGGPPARPPAGDATPAADGRARRRAVRQLPRGRAVARAADLRRPPGRVRTPDQARIERKRADQAAGGARHGRRDPPPVRRRPLGGTPGGRGADRALAAARHHARVPRRAAPLPRRRRVPGAVEGAVRQGPHARPAGDG